MWIVTNDLMDASTEEFETEEEARVTYETWKNSEYRKNGRVYLAEVKEYDGEPC